MAYQERNSSPAGEPRIIRGVVSRIIFSNPENGYAVLRFDAEDMDGEITAVGIFGEPHPGTHLVLRGSFKEHPRFGAQFSAETVTEVRPSSPADIERYLSSGIIKGIGKKTAERLVEAFGTETIEVIEKDPERLAQASGLGRHKAGLLVKAFSEQKEERDIMRFLIEHQLSPLLARKIYKAYGTRTIEIVSSDPYRLARDIWGVGFASADSIASRLGMAHDAPQRLRAGLLFALEKAAESEGHCYLPRRQLIERALQLLEVEETIGLGDHLDALARDELVVLEGEAVFLPVLLRAEDIVAGFIAKRSLPLPSPLVEPALVESALKEAEATLGVTYSPEQRQAVDFAVTSPLLIITGGPGCGKTTVVKAITAVLSRANKKILLAAPTGRAAQRVSQVCQLPASTIHRLLKFDPIGRTFFHGPSEPLKADVVIIDESSMIDIHLATSLFSAIAPHTTLILVGDKDQLPSVGPGRVLGDLLSIKAIKSVGLSRLFRRAEESSINTIAHMINAGQVPTVPVPDGETKTDAYFLPRSEASEAAELIEKLVSDQIPKKFGIAPNDITLLTPTNRGPLGTIELNKRLQRKLNPEAQLALMGQENEQYEVKLHTGDRVVQRVNNYQLDDAGVFNGDLGYVQSIDPESGRTIVELWDGRLIAYDREDTSQLSLAYAITVHRSQGSEVPCVVLALHDSHYALLERQLLYTGITRAKKLLIIVGSRRAFTIACKRASMQKRCTMLKQRVEGYLAR